MLLCCKEKLIRHEKTKLQASTVISLQFACSSTDLCCKWLFI